MNKILLLEDDADLQDLIKHNLEQLGYQVMAFSSVFEAKQAMPSMGRVSLMMADIKLIGAETGLDFCKYIKSQKQMASTPVIILSSNSASDFMKESLLCGAVDYLQKPIDMELLKLKISNLIQSQTGRAATASQGQLHFENIVLDLDAITVKVDEKPVTNLTRKEFKILEQLMQHQGTVIERDTLNKTVAGLDEYKITPRSIDTHIVHLRKALGPAGAYIKTVRGFGYQLIKE